MKRKIVPLPRLRTIVSVTDRFSSGRPYHNLLLPGLIVTLGKKAAYDVSNF